MLAVPTAPRQYDPIITHRFSPSSITSAKTPGMDRGAADYSGLPSPYQNTLAGSRSESSTADHTPATQYASQQQQPQSVQAPQPQPQQQQPQPQVHPEVRSSSFTTPTPVSSADYGVYPSSARSSSFPEHIQQRPYPPASNHSGSSSGMAHTPTSPSTPSHAARNLSPQQYQLPRSAETKSDHGVPIDPSISATSPTYAHPQYSPYAPPPQPQDMGHAYPPSNGVLYAQPRPDWAGYSQQHGAIAPTHHVFAAPRGAAHAAGTSQVYSFVPIPGTQQHKRPRRRYEEIERMYKCGWNGCEKAYGTLNHLNAHVTMQSHGAKRTPEEFKEIRKEWRARKKEEEASRKAAEEERRIAAAAAATASPEAHVQASVTAPVAGTLPPTTDGSHPPTTFQTTRPVQLPPIGYQGHYPAPPSASGVQQSMSEYGGNHMYPGYQPTSPYGATPTSMYHQRNSSGHGGH